MTKKYDDLAFEAIEESEKQTGFGDRKDLINFYLIKAVVMALLYIGRSISEAKMCWNK